MHTMSPLMQFLMSILQVLDNLYIVAALALLVIGVRVLYARSLRGTSVKGAPQKKNVTLEVIDTLLIALILVFGIVRPVLLKTFFIPSPSMVPTLLVDDKLIANTFVYRFREPQRGEVVVFTPPVEAYVGNNPLLYTRAWLEQYDGDISAEELTYIKLYLVQLSKDNGIPPGRLSATGTVETKQDLLSLLPLPPTRLDDYIKRTVGVPGDRIKIINGKGVFVNGDLLPEQYLPSDSPRSAIDFPEKPVDIGPVPRLKEVAGMSGGDALQRENEAINEYLKQMVVWLQSWKDQQYLYARRIQPYVEGETFVVPQGYIFVMGDNRTEHGSFDSRYWGLVPLDDVKARAVSTFFPLDRLKLL